MLSVVQYDTAYMRRPGIAVSRTTRFPSSRMSDLEDERSEAGDVHPTAAASNAMQTPAAPVEPAVAAAAAAASTGIMTASAEDAANARPVAPAAAATAEPLLAGIARLKTEQAQLRAERKRVAKELKNAERRRTRLRKQARQLSDADLVAVLQMRDTDSGTRSTSAAPAAENGAAGPAASNPANAGAAA